MKGYPMDPFSIRVMIEVELSRVEFEMLAAYADSTRRSIRNAAADMMLTGLTLGLMDESTYENPENFAPTTTTTTDDDDDDECGGKYPPAPPSPEALRAG